MRTSTAPTIRLKNYSPPAYTISTVELNVQLHPTDTKVQAKLRVHRAAGTLKNTPLVLDGDELSLDEIRINGRSLDKGEYAAHAQSLRIEAIPGDEAFDLEITTSLAPVENKKLSGLYQSSGVFCTQCEAEGFRRITYFLDRPDVLSVYTVRIEAGRDACQHLLSNGNPVESGDLGDGRHFAVWHDPHPKPSYLFALVGGNLDVLSDDFTTASGAPVALNIYVEPGKASMASYAMDALKRSMTWDEEVYGREYDLDVFNIVAVSDFNMGAMENKGLNVFNDKYVLADPNLATDTDYMNIEAIIAHEYFHNWTGNRITCRDWFQLCLKEGLTVYRDQEFSADQRSAVVQRIKQVKGLKAGQFTEDAGPLAHPVRPNAYKEINNFYTATVYQKGAELVRMIATLIGPELYRKGTDLYFERHDGDAALVEDFLRCFEDVSGQDLTKFARWYAQAGTPVVDVQDSWDAKSGEYTLTFQQSLAPTPGQKSKKLVPIPIRFGLIGPEGAPIAAKTTSSAVRDDLIILERSETRVTFKGLSHRPIPSLLRGFSAPIRLNFAEDADTLVFRAQHDDDAYNRWEALDSFALNVMVAQAKAAMDGETCIVDPRFLSALRDLTFDETLSPAYRAQALALPAPHAIAREIGKNIDPDAVRKAYVTVLQSVGEYLGEDALRKMAELAKSEASADPLPAGEMRALKNALLPLCMAAKLEGAAQFAQTQFAKATNMTDRMAALSSLLHWHDDAQAVQNALDAFYREFEDEPLVVNQWFALQATIPGQAGLKRVKNLIGHPTFSLDNPNRVRGLFSAFVGGNLTGFHAADGSGYTLFADQIIALDKLNPQMAARLLTLMNAWRIFEPGRTAKAEAELKRISRQSGLSTDVQEIVDRSLA